MARHDQLLYATGAFGLNVFHQTITLWLFYLYAPPPGTGRLALVPPVALGVLWTVGRIVDAFDDAVIGHWSDVTRTRWGRRLPFIVGGLPFTVAAFVALWTPPTVGGFWTLAYAAVTLQAFFILSSIVAQPYEAVLAEIVPTSVERVRVSSWKVTFGILGAGVGLVGSGLLIAAVGFPGMAIALGLLAAAALLVSTWGIRRLPQAPPHDRHLPLTEALRLTATNRQFLIFVCSEVLFYLGLNMLTQLMPYFVTVVLEAPEAQVSLFTAVFSIVALLSLPGVNWLAARRGKAFAYRLAMALLVVLLPGLFVIGWLPGIPRLAQGLIYMALLGAPMSVLFVLPHPMVADIVDDDALRTGLRREGIYYGIEDNLGKIGFAVSTAIFSVVLGTFGFSPEQPLGIRLIGPIAGLGVLLGLLIFMRGYRLPDQVLTPAAAGA